MKLTKITLFSTLFFIVKILSIIMILFVVEPFYENKSHSNVFIQRVSPTLLYASESIKTDETSHNSSEKERLLIEREKALKIKEKELKELEATITASLNEMEVEQKRLTALINELKNEQDKQLQHLIDVYSNMKAQQAGMVLETLDENIAVRILSGMKGRKAGEVLSFVEPKKAARLSELLTQIQMNAIPQQEKGK